MYLYVFVTSVNSKCDIGAFLLQCLGFVEELWRSPEPGGAVLALGNAWNAAAAATGELCLALHVPKGPASL